jgi:hypothetical protein
VVLVPWAAVTLTAAAGWAGLRALLVPRIPRALVVAALCTSPWLLAWQKGGTITDPVALAWLVACAALCAISRERPALLAVAIVAGGLAVGAKTSTLPIALLVLALTAYAQRARLRGLAAPLALGLAAAAAVGGVWYLRDLVTHGSPFWPTVAAPWGDPVPPSLAAVDATFVGHLGRTIDLVGSRYVDRFGGGLVLLTGGLLAPLVVPRRRIALAAVTVAAGIVVWARAPQTGVGADPGQAALAFTATRWLLPVVAVAALGLGVAAAEPRRRGALAPALALGAAACVNLVNTFHLGRWAVPPIGIPGAGALAGGLVAAPTLRRLRLPHPWARPAAAVFVVAVAAIMAVPASGFVERHAVTSPPITGPVTSSLANDSEYRTRAAGVESVLSIVGPLAGDRLQHRLAMLPTRASCATIAARARRAWLLVSAQPQGLTTVQVARCLGAPPAFGQGPYAAFRPTAPGP